MVVFNYNIHKFVLYNGMALVSRSLYISYLFVCLAVPLILFKIKRKKEKERQRQRLSKGPREREGKKEEKFRPKNVH